MQKIIINRHYITANRKAIAGGATTLSSLQPPIALKKYTASGKTCLSTTYCYECTLGEVRFVYNPFKADCSGAVVWAEWGSDEVESCISELNAETEMPLDAVSEATPQEECLPQPAPISEPLPPETQAEAPKGEPLPGPDSKPVRSQEVLTISASTAKLKARLRQRRVKSFQGWWAMPTLLIKKHQQQVLVGAATTRRLPDIARPPPYPPDRA